MKFLMNRKEMFAAFACLCMFMLNASCTNLSAVREWSKTSLEASQFNGIVATYVDTPVRLKRYDKLRFEQYRKPTGEQKRMFSLRQSLYDTNVTERKNQAEALKQILSVVSDYMGALATLSADGTVVVVLIQPQAISAERRTSVKASQRIVFRAIVYHEAYLKREGH